MSLWIYLTAFYVIAAWMTAWHVVREGGTSKVAAQFALIWPFWIAVLLAIVVVSGALRVWFFITDRARP